MTDFYFEGPPTEAIIERTLPSFDSLKKGSKEVAARTGTIFNKLLEYA